MMAELADGFIALPGGLGTLEELIEVLTWSQLGFHHKPAAVLNINGYYDHLLAFIAHCTDEQFLKPVHRDMLTCANSPQAALEELSANPPPLVDKWIPQ